MVRRRSLNAYSVMEKTRSQMLDVGKIYIYIKRRSIYMDRSLSLFKALFFKINWTYIIDDSSTSGTGDEIFDVSSFKCEIEHFSNVLNSYSRPSCTSAVANSQSELSKILAQLPGAMIMTDFYLIWRRNVDGHHPTSFHLSEAISW